MNLFNSLFAHSGIAQTNSFTYTQMVKLLKMGLSGTSTPGQSGPGSNGNEGVLIFHKTSALLEPYH